jgi:hypothetical protein
MFVRRAGERRIFDYSTEIEGVKLTMLGVLARGTRFEGMKLEGKSEFLDFSLRVELRPLLQWIENSSGANIMAWLHAMIDKALDVSECLPWLMEDDELEDARTYDGECDELDDEEDEDEIAADEDDDHQELSTEEQNEIVDDEDGGDLDQKCVT